MTSFYDRLRKERPPTAETQEPPQQTSTPIFDQYRDYVSADYGTDQEFVEALIGVLQQQGQTIQQSYQTPPAPAAPEPVQAEPEAPSDPLEAYLSSLSAPPQFEDTWMRMVDLDPQTGRYVPVSNVVPQEIVQGVNQYHDWQQKQLQKVSDPSFYSGLGEAIQEKISSQEEAIIQKAKEQFIAEQQTQQSASSFQGFIDDNAEVLYQYENGSLKTNPVNGEPLLTDSGQKFFEEYQKGLYYSRRLGQEDNNFAFDFASENWSAPEPEETVPEVQAEPEASPSIPEPSTRLQEQFQEEHQNPPQADLSGPRNGEERPGDFTASLRATATKQGIPLDE